MHILVADDEVPVAELLATVCARGPHRISLEASGAGVLDFLATTPVDLLVADVEMSDLPSPAFLAAIRSVQPGLPVLATITRDEPLLVADLLGEGAADVLRKPFTMDDFSMRLALVEERMRYARDFTAETAARRRWQAVAEFAPRTGVKEPSNYLAGSTGSRDRVSVRISLREWTSVGPSERSSAPIVAESSRSTSSPSGVRSSNT